MDLVRPAKGTNRERHPGKRGTVRHHRLRGLCRPHPTQHHRAPSGAYAPDPPRRPRSGSGYCAESLQPKQRVACILMYLHYTLRHISIENRPNQLVRRLRVGYSFCSGIVWCLLLLSPYYRYWASFERPTKEIPVMRDRKGRRRGDARRGQGA